MAVKAIGSGAAATATTTTSVVAATEVVAEGARNQRYADCYAEEFTATYDKVLGHYRKYREKYSEPHVCLDRSQAVDLMQPQTGTFTNPYYLHRLWRALRPSPGCPWCEHGGADMAHVLWECARNDDRPRGRTMTTEERSEARRLTERWQATLLSEAPEDQEWAVQRARAVAEDLGRCSWNCGSLADYSRAQ